MNKPFFILIIILMLIKPFGAFGGQNKEFQKDKAFYEDMLSYFLKLSCSESLKNTGINFDTDNSNYSQASIFSNLNVLASTGWPNADNRAEFIENLLRKVYGDPSEDVMSSNRCTKEELCSVGFLIENNLVEGEFNTDGDEIRKHYALTCYYKALPLPQAKANIMALAPGIQNYIKSHPEYQDLYQYTEHYFLDITENELRGLIGFYIQDSNTKFDISTIDLVIRIVRLFINKRPDDLYEYQVSMMKDLLSFIERNSEHHHHPEGFILLGDCYSCGFIFDKNDKKAESYYSKAKNFLTFCKQNTCIKQADEQWRIYKESLISNDGDTIPAFLPLIVLPIAFDYPLGTNLASYSAVNLSKCGVPKEVVGMASGQSYSGNTSALSTRSDSNDAAVDFRSQTVKPETESANNIGTIKDTFVAKFVGAGVCAGTTMCAHLAVGQSPTRAAIATVKGMIGEQLVGLGAYAGMKATGIENDAATLGAIWLQACTAAGIAAWEAPGPPPIRMAAGALAASKTPGMKAKISTGLTTIKNHVTRQRVGVALGALGGEAVHSGVEAAAYVASASAKQEGSYSWENRHNAAKFH
ncbi:MAG: hypothetical protein PUP46_03930 [Endozoicomonas sp. (ex Botrylloides leachii)]|nr:hypothetical protein [Endozoicomonas sp. (ex Botrylloides leachii)]